MLIKKIKYFSLFFFIFLIQDVVYAYNYSNTNIIENIKIEFDKSKNRAWIKNLFEASVDIDNLDNSQIIFQRIKKKYSRKWFDCYVIYKKKKYKAKVRIFGELKDHLQLPISSVKVKLSEGHISNITRFNLFLPKTRNGEKEIFWSLLMNYVGLKSFYTQMVGVNFMGNSYQAIFQEDTSKEYLERNKLKETLILKQNDYYHFNLINKNGVYPEFYSLVVNNGSFLKNKKSIEIASNAIYSFINTPENDLILNNSFFKLINNKYAWHGMLAHNRKFIYIPLEDKFEEIYYDGSVNFKSFRDYDCKLIVDNKFKKFEKHYYDLSNKKLSKIEKCIYFEKSKIHNFFIKNNQLPYKDNFYFESNFEVMKNNLKTVQSNILDFLNNKKKITKKSNTFLTFSFYHLDKYYLADYDININNTVSIREINYKKYKDSLRGRLFFNFLNEKIPVFNLGNILPKPKIITLSNEVFDKNKVILQDPGTYRIFLKKNTKYNKEIFFNSSNTNIIIQGEMDDDDSLVFKGVEKDHNNEKNDYRYDANLLNGCINFIKVQFNGGIISSEGMTCEDSINIVNSRGKIDQIKIENSNFDGLDIDISNLYIKDIHISNSRNDCLDLSYGKYKFINVKLENCKDKAISVGEKSTFNATNVIAESSNYGIVSKDSSIAIIDNLKSYKNKHCIAAYKKKQEFDGGLIKINIMDCYDYEKKIEKDNFSKIFINNNLI